MNDEKQPKPLTFRQMLQSVLAGALGVIVTFVMAYPTLAAVSGGGPLLVAAFAFAVGLGAACLVHPAAKDDRVVWLLLFVVAVGLTLMPFGN